MANKELSGTIRNITPVVVDGNTIYLFNLVKKEREYLEWDDEVYDAVFFAEGSENGFPNEVVLFLAFCKNEGAEVKIKIESKKAIPTANKASTKRRVRTLAIDYIEQPDYESGDGDDIDEFNRSDFLL